MQRYIKFRESIGPSYCRTCQRQIHTMGRDFHECYPLGSPEDLVAETHEDYKRCKERIYARLTRLTLFGTVRDLAHYIERYGLDNYIISRFE